MSRSKLTKINILGTDYEIIVDAGDNPKLDNSVAYVELFSKKIVVAPVGLDKMTAEKLDESIKGTLRHEIVHAFLFESGLSDYCHNEVLVEWIALQLPKLAETAKLAERVLFDNHKNIITEL